MAMTRLVTVAIIALAVLISMNQNSQLLATYTCQTPEEWFDDSAAYVADESQVGSGSESDSYDEQEERMEYKISPSLSNWYKKWPGGVVKYKIGSVLTTEQIGNLNQAFEEYQAKTCIRFELAKIGKGQDKDYVSIESNENVKCGKATVCMSGGQQHARFNKSCMNKATFVHELGHTLCLSHENWRGDRDQYVSFKNCSWEDNQKRLDMEQRHSKSNYTFEGIYDYASQMHYRCNCSGMGGIPTIENWKVCGDEIPGNDGLSIMDVEYVNELYECQGCHRHRWRPIATLTDEHRGIMYSFGYFDLSGRPLYPCRALVSGEVAVGVYTHKTGECVIPSRFANKSVTFTDKAEVLTIPDGTSNCDANGDFQYRLVSVFPEESTVKLQQAAVPAANGWSLDETKFGRGYIAFASFTMEDFELDANSVQNADMYTTVDTIGTAWNWGSDDNTLEGVFTTGKGNIVGSRHFKVLTCERLKKRGDFGEEKPGAGGDVTTCESGCSKDSTGVCQCSPFNDY